MNLYLKDIKESNSQGLQKIYKEFYPILKNYIVQNGGTSADAKDCFQEALIATFKRLQNENFEIKTTFSTYIFSVGKFIWFKKAKKNNLTIPLEDFKQGEIGKIEGNLIEENKFHLFQKGLKSLSKDCQKTLSYYFEGKNFKDISILMNYTGAEYARRKKYLCTKYLADYVKKDPMYQNLYLETT